MKIGVIGCGNMGGGMALQLHKAGLPVLCFDPDKSVRSRMAGQGLETDDAADSLAAQCSIVLLSLPTAAIVQSVMQEIHAHLTTDAIVLDTSTSTPKTSQAQYQLGKQHRFNFVDGPVSGGPAAANSGTMTMLLAGDASVIEKLKPVTDILTAKTVFVGPSGAGHAAKIANNMLCAANLVLVSEAVQLAKSAGVSAKDLLEGVNAGSGRSGVSEVNYPKWILNEQFDSGFTMGLMRKDVGLALALAQEGSINLHGFSTIADIWLNQSSYIEDDKDFNEITTFKAGT